MHRLILAIVLLVYLGAGCGWGYAAKSYPQVASPDDVLVIERNSAVPMVRAVEDPCAVSTFTVFLVEEGSRSIKDVNCGTGRTVSRSRKDIDRGEHRAFQAMNVPMGEWYLLVDPTPGVQRHRQVITNNQLLRLSRRYTFRYHHRMPDSGFMIYTFEGASPAPAIPR
jgi:hypothetical protein